MSQNSTIIPDSNGVSFLANLNNSNDTLKTNQSGLTAPATPSAGWAWLDTTLNLFKIRNTANTAWKTILDDEGIHASTSKTTPVDADEISILDSAATYGLKKLTWANLKAFFTLRTSSTGSSVLPSGTTAQRDGAPAAGYTRFNTDLTKAEIYNGTAWGSVGGGATGGGTDAAFMENDQAITTNYTLTANKNAISAGPISINTGVTVTVPTGATWTIV